MNERGMKTTKQSNVNDNNIRFDKIIHLPGTVSPLNVI